MRALRSPCSPSVPCASDDAQHLLERVEPFLGALRVPVAFLGALVFRGEVRGHGGRAAPGRACRRRRPGGRLPGARGTVVGRSTSSPESRPSSPALPAASCRTAPASRAVGRDRPLGRRTCATAVLVVGDELVSQLPPLHVVLLRHAVRVVADEHARAVRLGLGHLEASFSMTGWSANSLFSISACLRRCPASFAPVQVRPVADEVRGPEEGVAIETSRRPISYAVGTLKLPA